MHKPAYIVPTMRELAAVPDRGLRFASLFAGAGGSSTGYRMAGFRAVWANEFLESARQTYRANYPETPLDERDVRTIRPEEILEATGLEPGELDLLDGSPPCASFSMAGSRSELWGQEHAYGETRQRTDDLFPEYVRILEGLRPRVFVAENVAGLVRGVARGVFKETFRALAQAGYMVAARVLDAAWLGVPQERRRLFYIGVRSDVALAPVFPDPLPFQYTLADALGDLEAPDPPELLERLSFERYAIGAEWKRTPIGGAGARYFQLKRLSPNRPALTVTARAASVDAASIAHPFRPRKFSAEEVARLCSFPPDYAWPLGEEDAIERMGRAVPPLMMRAVAERLALEILERVPA